MLLLRLVDRRQGIRDNGQEKKEKRKKRKRKNIDNTNIDKLIF